MPKINLTELVKYIVWVATQKGHKLTQTRIIKFLYLADLYHARRNEGKTLSGWPWAFVYYGPYCSEAFSALKDAETQCLINKMTLESKFTDREEYNLYCCTDEEEFKEKSDIPFYIRMKLQYDIKKWGDDTQSLLDYVYFETEPMINALPKELLNFKIAQEPESIQKIIMKKLNKDSLQKGATLLEKLKTKHLSSQKEFITRETNRAKNNLYDEHFHQALSCMSDRRICNEFSGIAKIEFSKNKE